MVLNIEKLQHIREHKHWSFTVKGLKFYVENHKLFITAVEHGGGGVMVWACFDKNLLKVTLFSFFHDA